MPRSCWYTGIQPPTFIILKAMVTKTELLHWRLQAVLREHSFPDLEYIGKKKSYKTGEMVHWYRVGEQEVPVDAITEFECEEDEDGSEDTE